MRRRIAALALAAAAVLTAATAGCGDSTETGFEADRSRFDRRAERIVADWPDVRPVQGERDNDLLPLEGAERPRDRDEQGRAFTVLVGHGACDEDYGAWVREATGLVVVAGWAVEDEDVEVCTQELKIHSVVVRLDQDLGNRPVVDAVTGKALLRK